MPQETLTRNPRISAKKSKWHGICNPCEHQGRTTGHTQQGVFAMSIAKIQNAAFALASAFIVASLFVSAAVPVTPIA